MLKNIGLISLNGLIGPVDPNGLAGLIGHIGIGHISFVGSGLNVNGRGPVIILAKNKFAPNNIFRVVS